MKRALLVLLLATSATACQPTLATRGHFVDADEMALLSPGKSSKEDVRALIGSPTTQAAMDDSTWYYIGSNTEREGFRKEKVTDRRIIALKFNTDGILESVAPVENPGRDIKMVERITPTTGHNLTIPQQLFGNLGRFNDKGGPKTTGAGAPETGVND